MIYHVIVHLLDFLLIKVMAASDLMSLVSFQLNEWLEGTTYLHHIYKDRWCPHIDEELDCQQERHNYHDPFAVSVIKGSVIIGHVPKQISAICYAFLGKHNLSIPCKITGSRRYSHDLPQGGMEVPCTLTFQGQKVFVEKARKMLTKSTIGTPTLEKVTSSTPAINIGVIGSSKISVKTEAYSPEQEVHVDAKVIDSSQVTVKSELYLPEQVIHMNTEVTDSTQIAINTCVATKPMNDSFQKQSVEVLNVDNKQEDEPPKELVLESCHLQGSKEKKLRLDTGLKTIILILHRPSLKFSSPLKDYSAPCFKRPTKLLTTNCKSYTPEEIIGLWHVSFSQQLGP